MVCFHCLRENGNHLLRFLPVEDPTVWPKPALQTNMKYNCMGIQEGEGASTWAIRCRHRPWLQTWDKLSIWTRELLLTLLQHPEKHFVNLFMRYPSTTYTVPSPQATSSCIPCSSGCFKSFTVPSLTQQSAVSQVEPSGLSWRPWCQRARSTTALAEWRIPAYRTANRGWSTTEAPVRVFNKIWHHIRAISCVNPVCGPHFPGHISPSCWQDKHLSISPVIFPTKVGYTRPVPTLLYSALLLSAFPIKYLL